MAAFFLRATPDRVEAFNTLAWRVFVIVAAITIAAIVFAAGYSYGSHKKEASYAPKFLAMLQGRAAAPVVEHDAPSTMLLPTPTGNMRSANPANVLRLLSELPNLYERGISNVEDMRVELRRMGFAFDNSDLSAALAQARRVSNSPAPDATRAQSRKTRQTETADG